VSSNLERQLRCFAPEILISIQGMNGFRETKGHAITTFVAEREPVTFSHDNVVRQTMLVVNNTKQTGLRRLLAGAVRPFIVPLAAARCKHLLHAGWLDERRVRAVVAL